MHIGLASHKGMPCKIVLKSMSLGLRVDVGAYISIVKIVKNFNWLENGIIN